jgi:hypothetical protein
MEDKFKNNRIAKYLLETYWANDRKAFAKAALKSEAAVEYWFRKAPRGVENATIELLRYKALPGNKKIKLPDDL